MSMSSPSWWPCEEDPGIEGLLVLLNTVGGRCGGRAWRWRS